MKRHRDLDEKAQFHVGLSLADEDMTESRRAAHMKNPLKSAE